MQITNKQLWVIAAVIIGMIGIGLFDIQALVGPKKEAQEAAMVSDQSKEADGADHVSTETLIASAKLALSGESAAKIRVLSEKSAKNPQDVAVKKALILAWKGENSLVSALYAYDITAIKPNLVHYLEAASGLYKASKMLTIKAQIAYVIGKSKACYEKALALDPNNKEAKTGLAAILVEHSTSPMTGIAMLLDVIRADPNDLQAGLYLGLFSMKSGQYDKAEGRFLKLAQQHPSAEIYFYLGETYRNLGKQQKAMDAFVQAKSYVSSPDFLAKIDQSILNLK